MLRDGGPVHKPVCMLVTTGPSSGSYIVEAVTARGARPFAAAADAMSGLPYDRIVYAKSSPKVREDLAARIAETINAVQACFEHFAYYSKEGIWYSINSAALAVPWTPPVGAPPHPGKWHPGDGRPARP